MSEYIERERALEELKYSGCGSAYRDLATRRIMAIPATDVAPVIHGRWINQSEPDDDNNVTTECSRCFHSDTHAVDKEVPFCWFCGAKMDKEVTNA